jgi:hypothetical protein
MVDIKTGHEEWSAIANDFKLLAGQIETVNAATIHFVASVVDTFPGRRARMLQEAWATLLPQLLHSGEAVEEAARLLDSFSKEDSQSITSS